jgi:hypothetical protein
MFRVASASPRTTLCRHYSLPAIVQLPSSLRCPLKSKKAPLHSSGAFFSFKAGL